MNRSHYNRAIPLLTESSIVNTVEMMEDIAWLGPQTDPNAMENVSDSTTDRYYSGKNVS